VNHFKLRNINLTGLAIGLVPFRGPIHLCSDVSKEGGVGEGGGGGQARDLVFLFAGAVGAVGERGEVADEVLRRIVGAGAVSPAGGGACGRRASEKF
jgi:hypothetical protein